MRSLITKIQQTVVLSCCALALTACGGSGTSASNTTVSGVVMAGPAAGSSVTIKTSGGTVVAGPATTAADGSFSVAIPAAALGGDLIFEASGGTFPDEATAASGVTLGTLSAHVPAGSLAAGSTVTIDPSSTITRELIKAGLPRATALTNFAASFGYTPDIAVRPVFVGMSSVSTTEQRLAGLRAAAFSQLTKDLGLAAVDQFKLLLALVEDIKADGILDGKGTGGAAISFTTATGATFTLPADITNRFSAALVTFLNSNLNKSKLTIDRLGAPLFARTALTASYKVDYIPGSSAAAQGKTSFQIRLTSLGTNTPAAGLAASMTLAPKMYMATMSHGSPVDTVTESSTPGTYDCTVYYLMASGPGMGIWELKVKIGSETATFYPPVAMAMGSTPRASLKGVTDTIGSMMGMGTSARTYYLFNEGVTGMGPYTFKLFIAAADDSMLMKFPAVYGRATLHDAMNSAWSINSGTSSVQVSSDSGSTWVNAVDGGNGHWIAAGLTGLASGGTIRVKVNINGEQKTTAGLATLSATNLDYAPFTIAAGM